MDAQNGPRRIAPPVWVAALALVGLLAVGFLGLFRHDLTASALAFFFLVLSHFLYSRFRGEPPLRQPDR